ncbi:translation initiation factor IF-2 [Phaeodactylibacter sp.]|uniref:translation initiation factor IF-2 n=1 Tax=Phaeodactylibacter sp. TaxID=1940289 RepID=UPI0025D06186|nr:translation initiation factor IF-2 [Phaeodactylibacter sp.]MCI4648869.1 translation initiation factor IF-2 [Phaeodactylibacter sp.]MCI5092832.1 translation initiation factor IF-2 [Phaeodactylibacter sp.]
MAKRLVKIAKELNVGTSTIVEHLTNNGFEIENKPTAKISDEMYTELLKEFQKSIAIKEKADQLVIGNRPSAEEPEKGEHKMPEKSAPKPREEVKKPVAKVSPPVEKTTPATEKPAAPKPPAAPEKAPSPETKAKPEEEKTEQPAEKKTGLKVLGKIDLDAPNKGKKQPAEPPKEPKAEPPKAEAEKAEKEEPVAPKPETPAKQEPAEEKPAAKKEVPEPKEEAKAPEKEDSKTEAPKPEEAPAAKGDVPSKPDKADDAPEQAPEQEQAASSDEKSKPAAAEASPSKKEAGASDKATETGDAAASQPKGVVKAEAPELRGLKILGKIDVDKVDRSSRKKKKKEEPKKEGTTGSSNDEPRKKRRRKRKKVAAPSDSGSGKSGTAKGGRRSNNKRGRKKDDEVKEVSQKEIEDKIKATMARISGGGTKRKRQKLRRDNRERLRERQEEREQEMESKFLEVTEFISVQELANMMDVGVTDVITTCMNLGVIVSINQRLDAEIIELVTEEFGHEVKFINAGEEDEEEEEIIDDPEDLEPRAPIVTVMGHVDHGKTSLLDYIRQEKVADDEAGGITQHIGAYEVNLGDEDDITKKITFLDTPGHEAFTAMRARGAKVTDIAVIIIAADDNIMPQTKEAISHAQAAGVPMVFAINKVDKPGAQPERIKQELASMDFLVEEWGGKYQSQDISAKTGQGIDDLLEKILLEAELLELQANPDREAVGAVIEASLDKGRGYVTKILVQTGTLKIGDPMVAGEHSGKVKAMFNERGKRVDEAGPSSPVLVLGLGGAPQAGERFRVMENEQEARTLATKRAQISREQANRATKRISLDEIGRRLALGNFKELNLIVKGDVDGSVEALSDSLIKQSIESIQVNVIHKAVGQIIESDVLLASASDAIIIGFQVRPSMGARKLAEREGVEINTYSIIYEAIEEVRAAIEGMLEPTKEENITAQVEVRETFKISKVGTVAGCFVQEGKINRNSLIRIIRDGIVIYPVKEGQTAELSSLKRYKDDVREVKSGMECGLSVRNYNDIKVGDIIEAYEIVEIKQTLD